MAREHVPVPSSGMMLNAPPSPEPDTARTRGTLAADRLFAARTVLVFGEITPTLAESVTTQLLALAASGPERILVVVNSPGGHVESADTIHDAIRYIGPEVLLLGTGWVASAGALIYVATERSRRFALPNTRFLLHEPSGGASGQVSDVEIEAQQALATRERLLRIFAQATDQPLDKLARDTRRNHWLNAEQAVAYGLVGRIIERAADLNSPA